MDARRRTDANTHRGPLEDSRGELCRRVRDELESDLGPERVRRHLGACVRLDATDSGLEVLAPDRFTLDMIERRLGGALRDALGRVAPGRDARVAYRVGGARSRKPRAERAMTRAEDRAARAGPSAGRGPGSGRGPGPGKGASGRRAAGAPRPGLEAFVAGACNEVALGAVRQCVESGSGVPPVLVHGGCGLGKTHLLRGAAMRMRRLKAGAKVVEMSGDAFTGAFVSAVKRRQVPAFERRFRGIDLLCLDDVHLLAGKTQTQHELLLIFETLTLCGARLILASDEPPARIGRIHGSLASRLASGVVARLDPPDRETGGRLLLELARRHGVTLDPGTLGLVLDRVGIGRGISVRELEGAVLQIKAVAACTHAPGADLATVSRAMDLRGAGGAGHAHGRGPIPLELILRVVCDELGVSAGELRDRGRHKRVVLAREMCVHGAKSLTNASYPEIAHAMGRPNHSSVISAYNRAAERIERNEPIDPGSGRTYASLAAHLCERIRAAHAPV